MCNSVFFFVDMKKLPQNNMDQSLKQAKANSHTEATDSDSPAPVLRLTFERRDLELRICSLLFLQELHFTGTTQLSLDFMSELLPCFFFLFVTLLAGFFSLAYHVVLTV